MAPLPDCNAAISDVNCMQSALGGPFVLTSADNGGQWGFRVNLVPQSSSLGCIPPHALQTAARPVTTPPHKPQISPVS